MNLAAKNTDALQQKQMVGRVCEEQLRKERISYSASVNEHIDEGVLRFGQPVVVGNDDKNEQRDDLGFAVKEKALGELLQKGKGGLEKPNSLKSKRVVQS